MIKTILFFCLIPFMTYAVPCKKEGYNTQKQLETYLNQLPSIKAAFQQKNTDAPAILGTLYIDKKNGYMHIDYPTIGQKIIVRNGTLYLADSTDKSVQDISASYTPAGLLLQKDIKFNETVHVLAFSENDTNAYITLASTKSGDEGSMKIDFSLKPFIKINGWSVLDAQGNQIDVDITKFEAGITLDKSLFDRPEF